MAGRIVGHQVGLRPARRRGFVTELVQFTIHKSYRLRPEIPVLNGYK